MQSTFRRALFGSTLSFSAYYLYSTLSQNKLIGDLNKKFIANANQPEREIKGFEIQSPPWV